MRVGTQPRGIMLERIVEEPNYDYMCEQYRGQLLKQLGGIAINLDNSTVASESDWVLDYEKTNWKQITWVAPFKEWIILKDLAMAYGNEVAAEYIYCSPCLIVPIGPASDRV